MDCRGIDDSSGERANSACNSKPARHGWSDAPDNVLRLVLASGDIAAGEWMLLNDCGRIDGAAQASKGAGGMPDGKARTRRPFPAGAMAARLAIAAMLMLFVVVMMSMSRIATSETSGFGLAVSNRCDTTLGSESSRAPAGAQAPDRMPADATQAQAGGKS